MERGVPEVSKNHLNFASKSLIYCSWGIKNNNTILICEATP